LSILSHRTLPNFGTAEEVGYRPIIYSV